MPKIGQPGTLRRPSRASAHDAACRVQGGADCAVARSRCAGAGRRPRSCPIRDRHAVRRGAAAPRSARVHGGTHPGAPHALPGTAVGRVVFFLPAAFHSARVGRGAWICAAPAPGRLMPQPGATEEAVPCEPWQGDVTPWSGCCSWRRYPRRHRWPRRISPLRWWRTTVAACTWARWCAPRSPSPTSAAAAPPVAAECRSPATSSTTPTAAVVARPSRPPSRGHCSSAGTGTSPAWPSAPSRPASSPSASRPCPPVPRVCSMPAPTPTANPTAPTTRPRAPWSSPRRPPPTWVSRSVPTAAARQRVTRSMSPSRRATSAARMRRVRRCRSPSPRPCA